MFLLTIWSSGWVRQSIVVLWLFLGQVSVFLIFPSRNFFNCWGVLKSPCDSAHSSMAAMPNLDNQVFTLLLGHSFIRRLKVSLQRDNSLNLGLNSSEFSLLWQGFGGIAIKHLSNYEYLINNLQPTIMYVEIGSNDLCYRKAQVDQLADHLYSWVLSILARYSCVKKIIVGQVIPRLNQPYPHYNKQVTQFNALFREKCLNHPGIVTWKHKGLVTAFANCLLPDGVHLNSVGEKKFKHSIKRALVYASKDF